MAETGPVKYGQGGARKDTINDLNKKKEIVEAQKQKNFLREQIVFVVIACASVVPFVLAFKTKDSKQAYMLFKLGGAMLIGLYPCYVLLRFLIGSMIKPKAQ